MDLQYRVSLSRILTKEILARLRSRMIKCRHHLEQVVDQSFVQLRIFVVSGVCQNEAPEEASTRWHLACSSIRQELQDSFDVLDFFLRPLLNLHQLNAERDQSSSKANAFVAVEDLPDEEFSVTRSVFSLLLIS